MVCCYLRGGMISSSHGDAVPVKGILVKNLERRKESHKYAELWEKSQKIQKRSKNKPG